VSELKAESAPDGDLPDPSAELVLIRVAIEAYLSTAHVKPRNRARTFFDAASRILADEESVAALFPIRPAPKHSAVRKARRQAVAMWDAFVPTFLARLPPE
jgi:hypothetical protein